MKDPIVNTRPEVLGILLNTTLARYAKAGVHYVEYSVSCGDLLDDTKFEALLDMAFNSKLSKPKPKTTSTATLHTPAPSKPPKGQKRTESASKDSGKLPRPESAQKRQKSSQPTSIPVNLEEEFGTAEPEVARFMSITDHTETELDQDIVVNTNTEPAAAARLTPSRLKDVMPSTNLKNAGPAWRLHINYIAKEPNQEYRFLAAFPRYTADKGPLCHEISGGEWRVAHAPLVSPRTAYSKLGEIASDLFEMYTFLEVQGVERAAQLPNWAEVARATRDEVNGRIFQDLCSTGNICRYLEAVAKHLCADTFLEQLYPHHLVGIDGKETKIEQMTRTIQTDEERRYLRAMVGLDWVGDELGHPFCIFSHDKFIAFVAECMVYNPNFGVRIHAGEGPIRPSTLDDKTSQVSLAFYLHMYIVCESIKIYRRKLADVLLPTGKKPNIRIGHGVAFLFGCYELNSVDPFISYLKDFRKNFLQRYKIVCELNPTSNHMLLPSTFQQGAQLQNHRTLPTFLKEKLPVVLGTDDDGIWAIHKCKCHYHHVSVAAEYCHAIDCGDITNNADLKDMLVWGRKSAFSSCKENDLNQVDEDEVVEQEEMEHSEF